MSYRGATVIINIPPIIPFIGHILVDFIYYKDFGFTRVFVRHFPSGFPIGLFILVHIFLLHTFTNSIPLLNSASSSIIPSFPPPFKDSFSLLLLSCFPFSSFLFKDPDTFGNCENNIYSNPPNTPLFTLPE